ncbi:MAG: hypothetical protein U5O16_37670, partial [Rhodococcus sp. (in: high G+C Gram-positive bacteria)]|uniref:hypothetical protein n=1 Tax=Rhodococcus sp. TaxID=1831 RepID=UPI002AD695F6|nr:hypothetical protein [Rhodococcus sp. (in: high G+C Gram-positive bacteria)]
KAMCARSTWRRCYQLADRPGARRLSWNLHPGVVYDHRPGPARAARAHAHRGLLLTSPVPSTPTEADLDDLVAAMRKVLCSVRPSCMIHPSLPRQMPMPGPRAHAVAA